MAERDAFTPKHPSIEDIGATAASQAEETLDPEDVERSTSQQDDLDRGHRRNLREKYAHRVFTLVCVWLATVLFMLFLQGITRDDWLFRFRLEQTLWYWILSTTSASVVGLLVTVVLDLFPLGRRSNAAGEPAAS